MSRNKREGKYVGSYRGKQVRTHKFKNWYYFKVDSDFAYYEMVSNAIKFYKFKDKE